MRQAKQPRTLKHWTYEVEAPGLKVVERITITGRSSYQARDRARREFIKNHNIESNRTIIVRKVSIKDAS